MMDWATLLGSSLSKITCPTMMSSGTVGSGTGSVTNRMVATTDMDSTIWPSWVRPSGVGNWRISTPVRMAMMNQRLS